MIYWKGKKQGKVDIDFLDSYLDLMIDFEYYRKESQKEFNKYLTNLEHSYNKVNF